MNIFIVEVDKTDRFTYWAKETYPIKTNLTLEELFCKIDDRLKGGKSIILDGWEIFPEEEWNISTLDEWLDKAKLENCEHK